MSKYFLIGGAYLIHHCLSLVVVITLIITMVVVVVTIVVVVVVSVAMDITDVFRKNGINISNKFVRILKTFTKIYDIKNRGVIYGT